MNVVAHAPLGVEVAGVHLADLAPDTVRTLLATHGVLLLRDQDVDDKEFRAFLLQFGELEFTVGETPLDGFPDLNVVSNVGRETPPRSSFHVDTSYVSRPPAFTALRAVTVPDEGGETLFSNQYRAYDTLALAAQEDLAGRYLRHVVTGVDPGPDQEHEAVHPLVRQHPESGRLALFLTTPSRCADVTGLSADEGRELVERLYAHSTREDNLLRHVWRPGDVVMWDNRCVMHRADHSGVVGDRVLHRGMVTG